MVSHKHNYTYIHVNLTSPALAKCNAVYGEYGHHGNMSIELKAYANLHLERSYEYLLSASYYNNYKTNRAGFSKLFRKLSDNAWEKTIDLIKHVTMRGKSDIYFCKY